MDHKDRKDADTSSEPQIDVAAEIDDGDLEIVTGGLKSGATEDLTASCVTTTG